MTIDIGIVGAGNRGEAHAAQYADVEAARTFVAEAETQIHATLTPEQFEDLRDDLAEAKERGVTVNLTLLSRDEDRDLGAVDFEGVCTEVHRLPRPSPFIVTSDLRRTAFASNPTAVEDYGMILENRSFTYVFFWHFLIFMWLPWPVLYAEAWSSAPGQRPEIFTGSGEIHATRSAADFRSIPACYPVRRSVVPRSRPSASPVLRGFLPLSPSVP